MACVRKTVEVAAPADEVWAAVRDVGALHTRLVRGFVVDTRVEGDDRVVTFANAVVQREPVVDLDDARRRLAYTAVDSALGATHYHGEVQVHERDGGATVMWVVDVLPHGLRDVLDAVMERGAVAMRATLEADLAR